jgi:GDPmannose 4,6-dehydratase
VFGRPIGKKQTEETPFDPQSPYAVSKAAGIHVCRYFRNDHSFFASAGILYNHESPRRSSRFLSKKVVQGAVNIKLGRQSELLLGHLDSLVDWGFAPDYVSAMWNILQLSSPGDFIVATGTLRTVREFVHYTFELLGLDASRYVVERRDLITRPGVPRCGDATRLRQVAEWKPTTTFEEMIRNMVEAELNNES